MQAGRGGAGDLRALLGALVTEPGSEEEGGRERKGEKKKEKERGREREKEREKREIAPAGFTAATAAGRARAPVGDAHRVARNEGKKGMGICTGVGTAGRRD